MECEHLFTGHAIKRIEDNEGVIHLHTLSCTFEHKFWLVHALLLWIYLPMNLSDLTARLAISFLFLIAFSGCERNPAATARIMEATGRALNPEEPIREAEVAKKASEAAVSVAEANKKAAEANKSAAEANKSTAEALERTAKTMTERQLKTATPTPSVSPKPQ
ncbi:MAG: hypothetical protein ABMA13_00735 [Chthoniobacteraceae bacterium]